MDAGYFMTGILVISGFGNYSLIIIINIVLVVIFLIHLALPTVLAHLEIVSTRIHFQTLKISTIIIQWH
jgi:nicotinamide riboside transporter PnuC